MTRRERDLRHLRRAERQVHRLTSRFFRLLAWLAPRWALRRRRAQLALASALQEQSRRPARLARDPGGLARRRKETGDIDPDGGWRRMPP